MFCTSCGASAIEGARFCAKCGAPIAQADSDSTALRETAVSAEDLETIAPSVPPARVAAPRPAASHSRPRSSPASNPTLVTSDPIGGGRFAPGVIIAGRYRIVALLGRGGMGEVYRAEDLRLSQVLAIKFLPEALSKDDAALARFHSEVRVARQVSHPNVCRVFDIGDADGIPFLTMEYVDGEDLSSLIRRIGRLPQDKALEVSRQICAGLAAAHERGVIHRDLKPANVMLDGAGKARITDFGLAGLATSMHGAEVRAGTPAYMAPEQLAGKEVTVKSDIYALGLVMYELLTGKRVYEAKSFAELLKSRQEGTITNPSTLVKDLDPLVERVILRCLEKDPARRPSSALQVAAALPGGDPLAAALAAGETPSPEMVAAAGSTEGLPPKLAVACLASVLILAAISAYLGVRESGLRRIHPQYSTEVLQHKAREILATLGYPEQPADAASGFTYDEDYLAYLAKTNLGESWNSVLTEQPPTLQCWYRQSPKAMVPYRASGISLTPGVVTLTDPPPIFSGMINMRLDPVGRLLYFQSMPQQREEHSAPAKEPDWQPLLSAAGLKLADLRPTTPTWNGLASADNRAAWDGKWPGTTHPLHVEAAALHGRPVFFQLSGPWMIPWRMLPPEQTASERAGSMFGITFALVLVAAGIWLSYRNYRRGKGDRRGAWRLAWVMFALELVVFLSRAHLRFGSGTLYLLAFAISTGLFISAFMWTLYMALEPYVRSKWPQTIVSWSRVLAGNIRDPLVGRDVLYGVLMGMAWVIVYYAGYYFDMLRGERPLLPQTDLIESTRAAFAMWLGNIVGAIFGVMLFFFILVFFRVLVRNRWIAALLFVVVFALPKILATHHPLIDSPVWILIYVIAAVAVVRFGLVVLAVAGFTADLLLNLPFTMDLSAWYAPASTCVVLSILALAIWGFHTALAGQPLFKEDRFE